MKPSDIPLPKSWPTMVKSAVLQVISLAHYIMIYTRSWRRDSNPSMKPDYSSANFSPLHFLSQLLPRPSVSSIREIVSAFYPVFCAIRFGLSMYAQPTKINTSRPFSTTGSKALKGSIGLRDHNEQSPNITLHGQVYFFRFLSSP